MAIMDFDSDSRRMRVISLHPGYTFDDVQENCGFELLKSDDLADTSAPTDVELEILRTKVDPDGYVIGR